MELIFGCFWKAVCYPHFESDVLVKGISVCVHVEVNVTFSQT